MISLTKYYPILGASRKTIYKVVFFLNNLYVRSTWLIFLKPFKSNFFRKECLNWQVSIYVHGDYHDRTVIRCMHFNAASMITNLNNVLVSNFMLNMEIFKMCTF